MGLADTSVFIAQESGRPLNVDRLPDELCVSVITLAELNVGVLAARDTATRARRLPTLELAQSLLPLQVDATAASEWARLRVRLAEVGRRLNVNDLWIAAVALANGIPVVTQDNDFDPLQDLEGPEVIKV